MFYSHQLLARKAPLGQIWMAATMHSKINRRKLVQIDLIRICEEILNPSVPMALRLSGILMGGVVIVYERKVKLLYDDVNRLLVELNTAWKVKPTKDPTILPKGKNQAKFEDVTLPEKQDADIGDIEQSIDNSSRFTSSATFQQTTYFAMRLDTIDELGESFREKEPNEQHHQADPANITLPPDPFWPPAPGLFNHFERFDIDGDEETFNNFPSQGQTDMPQPSVHSPPPEMEIPKEDNLKNPFMADDTHVQHPEEQADLSSPKEARQYQRNIPMQRPARKKARQAPFIMDNEQIMIPSSMYQTWLHDTTDTWFKRPKITEQAKGKSAVKLAKLLDLPPVALSCGLVGKGNEVNYPKQLLDLWFTSMQPVQDSPSGKTTSPNPPEPSSSSPPLAQEYHHDPLENPMGDFGTGVPTVRFPSGERLVPDPAEDTIYANRIFHEGLATDNPNPNPTTTNSGTPQADPSPDPGVDYASNNSNSISGRLSKKRLSSANHNSTGLESVDEENPWVHAAAVDTLPVLKEQPQQRSKMPKYSRNSATPDHEILVETGPTQTQQAAVMNEEAERKASSIATQFKSYFEAPGAPEKESLNQLALGLNKRGAAQLFYQTCVLATRDILKVEQKSAYGDIIISRGPKM